MGPVADTINKCLLPYRGRAIISHLIDHFPADTHFVIALGYKAEQVRTYLGMMHPEQRFDFVNVDRFTGAGTGPGYSLSCCRGQLPGAFYFIAGDGVFDSIPHDISCNWLAVSLAKNEHPDHYCNIGLHDAPAGRAQAIYDKQRPPAGVHTGVFTGLMHIKDADIFWESLVNTQDAIAGEHQISSGFSALLARDLLHTHAVNWQDLGTHESYRCARAEEAYDFSKIDECIYFSPQRVVKFFSDPRVVQQRVEKARLLPEVFPQIIGHEGQFYAYRKVPGSTAYECLDLALSARLLEWLKQNLWLPRAVDATHMSALCRKFYFDKTAERLAAYQKKYAAVAEPESVNGIAVMPVATLLKKLPDTLLQGVPVFMHGDLHYDNIIVHDGGFTLIDWRQDFAGEIAYGDWYYDVAKFLGGIHLNYDYIKRGLVRFEQRGTEVWIDYAVRQNAPEYAAQLKAFVRAKGLDIHRAEILRGLIYLNMAPLHHPPFDRMLFALAKQLLTQVLA